MQDPSGVSNFTDERQGETSRVVQRVPTPFLSDRFRQGASLES